MQRYRDPEIQRNRETEKQRYRDVHRNTVTTRKRDIDIYSDKEIKNYVTRRLEREEKKFQKFEFYIWKYQKKFLQKSKLFSL